MSMPAKKRPTASAPSARAHLEQAIALYDPQQHRSLAFTYGEQAGVPTRGFAAHTLWYLGYPDQALEHFHRAGLGIDIETIRRQWLRRSCRASLCAMTAADLTHPWSLVSPWLYGRAQTVRMATACLLALILANGVAAHAETDVFMRTVGFALTGSDDADPKLIGDPAKCVFASKNEIFPPEQRSH